MMEGMKQNRINRLVFLVWVALLPLAALCQAPTIKTTITKNQILIGEQLQLKVKAQVSLNEYTVDWFVLPDSTGHFEVVDPGKLDTTGSGNTAVLQQTITLTSFDSGSWATPAFAVACKRIDNSNTTMLYADSMPVTVSFAVDTSMQLKDIKPIFDVRDKWPLWYYLAGAGVVLLVVLIAVLLYFYLSRKKQTGLSGTGLSAYNEAVNAFAQLQQPDTAKPESVKLYHTKLAEIIKLYVSRKNRVQVKGQTTGELLVYVMGRYPDNELKIKLAAVLRCSDAVKFAKFLPGTMENAESLASAKKIIEQMEQFQIPQKN
jgi:hypothetical protein